MPPIRIEDLADERLNVYRELRTRNLSHISGKFVVESRVLAQRLVHSDYTVDSLLVDDIAYPECVDWIPSTVPVYIIQRPQVSELIGFHFHRGVLACGHRKPRQRFAAAHAAKPLDRLNIGELTTRWTGVYCVAIHDPENLGQIARTCSALGIRDLILGPECVDAFSRRVLRVSMGCMFNLRVAYEECPVEFLQRIKDAGIKSVATSLVTDSVELQNFVRSGPTLLILGNEAVGLPQEVQSVADERIKIEMQLGTDSLNVSVAAGILLHSIHRLSQA